MSRPIGPDVDLDTEEVLLGDGRRLTPQLAEEIAEEALAAARRPGRPSVSGDKPTPNLTIRVSPKVRQALQRIADQDGRRLADVSREALDEYVKRHGRVQKAAPKKMPARARAGSAS